MIYQILDFFFLKFFNEHLATCIQYYMKGDLDFFGECWERWFMKTFMISKTDKIEGLGCLHTVE